MKKYSMYLNRKIYLLSILLFFLNIYGKAEYNCIFEHLSTEDGLSHGNISAMLKDSRGFMWFATWDGINRYDGHTFKTFKPGSGKGSNSASNRIETIKEDSLGNIWVINYDSKAFRLNHLSEVFDPIPVHSDNASVDVRNIFPTKYGDVWVTTNNSGIFRVVTDTLTNQFSLLHYDMNSELQLPGNKIRFIAEDALNHIWVYTNNGLVCFMTDTLGEKLIQKVFSKQANEVLNRYNLTYFYTSTSQLFLGTDDGAVLVYNLSNGDIQEIEFENKAVISNIIGDLKGSLFFGTNGNGIFKYSEKTQGITNHYSHPNIENVLNTYVDSQGLLWIESSKVGIARIIISTGDFKHFDQILGVNLDLRSSAQCGMMEDEYQTLWLTFKGGGFGSYNRETDEVDYFFNKPGDPQSKISNFVNCFYKDPSGVLWMSTYFKGIEKITFIQKKFQFVQPSPQSKLSIANEVRALLEDSKGYLWVATKNEEFFLLDPDFNIVKKIDELNGEKIGRIYALLEDNKGAIYLGSKGNGLFKLTRKGKLDFDVIHYLNIPGDPSSISNNNIYSLLEDKAGRIWIGTYGGGTNLLINNQFLHAQNGLKKFPKDKGAKVRHMAEDRKGNIWMGTTDGLILLKPEGDLPSDYSFYFFDKENGNAKGLLSNDIFWIFCDSQNNIWMSSLGGGLAKLENYSIKENTLEFTVFSKAEGLPSDMVFTITNDEDGNLWMSTENGIVFYSPKEKVFRNYSQYDGILKSGFSEAAIATRADGHICFGANNGLYFFHPSQFKNDQKKVDIIFTSFQLFGKEISPSNESVLNVSITETSAIQLKYNQNVFGITWAGLDFKLQDKIQYAYKLEGFDDDWRYARELNQANYTKIPPGKYTFWVKFSNPELQSFNRPESIIVEILPPFWKTTWAYIIYLIIAIAIVEITRRIVTSMIRLRNKIVIEKELTNIKLNFFTNISHELRTPLTLILDPVKEIKEKEKLSEKGKIYANLIEVNAQRLLRLVNQLLDFRKIQSDKMELSVKEMDIVPFVQKVCHNFDELANEKKIHFNVNSKVGSLVTSIDEEKIDSVIFNILSNAFKFTPNNGFVEVEIDETIDEQKIQLKIIDSGIGVPKDQEASLFKVFASNLDNNQTKYYGTGIGLALSKGLVELHNGELTYQPTPEGGATFIIQLNSSKGLTHQVKLSNKEINPQIDTMSTKRQVTNSINTSKELPRILIVEDNPELRRYLKLQLDDDYQIEEAENGREGLVKALKIQPDIILSDVMMPEMDGIQLLEQIKNNFESSHIPVILLTARSSVQSKIEGLKYGADAYITKPFNSEQLKVQLENLLHQRIVLRERYANHNPDSKNDNAILLTDKDATLLNQVREIIETNLSNTDFKIENIYTHVGMGRSKFFDKLKGLTGLSPIDFVKEYRLNKAQSLLKTGNYNVTETSYLSGFTDAGYLSKCYKERFGVSPSQVGKN